jgi:UDP-N-acetylglucosamine acyltransferase
LDAHPSEYRLIQGAWVHATARLPEDPKGVHFEPGALIGAGVELGHGTWVGACAVIYGPTRLGEKNQVYPHAVLGAPPQDLSYAGQPTRLEIGDRNIFREGVTIHRASTKATGFTRIGNDNFFMASSHVAHDCTIENRVVFANAVMVAGHCHVQSNVNLAGGCAVAQFCTVGRFAFVCGTSGVRKDLEPFISHDIRTKTYGETQPACINEVGLKRAGITLETIQKLRTAYKVLYLRGSIDDLVSARNEIEGRGGWCPETEELLGFIERKRKSRFGRALSA